MKKFRTTTHTSSVDEYISEPMFDCFRCRVVGIDILKEI